MWLLIETNMRKDSYRLFTLREIAIRFLDAVGAVQEDKNVFVCLKSSERNGWKSQRPVRYRLIFLEVNDHYEPSIMDVINAEINESVKRNEL